MLPRTTIKTIWVMTKVGNIMKNHKNSFTIHAPRWMQHEGIKIHTKIAFFCPHMTKTARTLVKTHIDYLQSSNPKL